MKILFVCWGNVGRSQMAQAYYNHFTKSNDAFSAGTDSESPPQYPEMSKVFCDLMLEEKIDMSHHYVKLITKEYVRFTFSDTCLAIKSLLLGSSVD